MITAMSKIVRYEFMGNWLLFWLACVSIVGIPLAFLYFVNGTVRVEDDLADPEEFLEKYRSSK